MRVGEGSLEKKKNESHRHQVTNYGSFNNDSVKLNINDNVKLNINDTMVNNFEIPALKNDPVELIFSHDFTLSISSRVARAATNPILSVKKVELIKVD